jgi:predicted Zn-dependent protease
MSNRMLVCLVASLMTACASTTQGGAVGAKRRQFLLGSSDEMLKESTKAYEQVKAEAQAKGNLDRNAAQTSRVVAISKRLIPEATVFRADAPKWPWEVHVVTTPELNAFCMPGGKIIFFSGIIEKLELTDGEIAAIMGHEISHALREHGRERVSQAAVTEAVLTAAVGIGLVEAKYAGLLAKGAPFLLLPFSRGEETEADTLGLELMARAGYDPHEALSLWRKMARASGGKQPPELLSTHPSNERRIKHIETLIPTVMPLYHPR